MLSNLENTISEFKDMLNHEDPIILARLQTEVLLETLRLAMYQFQSMNDKLANIERQVGSIDWKLWEEFKLAHPDMPIQDNES